MRSWLQKWIGEFSPLRWLFLVSGVAVFAFPWIAMLYVALFLPQNNAVGLILPLPFCVIGGIIIAGIGLMIDRYRK